MAKHNDTGKLGERLALEWIIEKGYKIIEKNYPGFKWISYNILSITIKSENDNQFFLIEDVYL